MFLQDKNSLFKDQKNIRPKIEDIITDVKEDFWENIHKFTSYLKENSSILGIFDEVKNNNPKILSKII